ncbi:hypothetical protein XANCAGTX0491_008326 [Xanthoria calcicola]
MKSLAIIIGTAALGIHGIAGAALPVDFLKRQTINGSKSHCGPGADLCGWRESGPLCCRPPPDDPGNGSFPPGNIIGTRDEKDSNVPRGEMKSTLSAEKEKNTDVDEDNEHPPFASEIETSTGADGGAELIPDPVRGTSELRPRQIFSAFAPQPPNKAVQEAAKAGQEIIEDKDFHDGRCWVLHGNTRDCRKKLQDPNAKFKVAAFDDCYEAKKCPKKRSRIADAPELNPGAKGQKLSQGSEIDARAALADAVPDPTSKDANVLAAAVYDAAKKTEHKIINGRLEERTDTSIAERDAIPDLPTHLDEEYYRYTEREVANPDPTASHPASAPKPEIRRAWGGAGMVNNAKPKPKPPHPAQSRSRRAWGGAGMIQHPKPKSKPPHPAHP